MANTDSMTQLTLIFAQQGIFGDDIPKMIDKIVAAIPPATREKYPDDKVEAALAFWPMYTEMTNTGAGAGTPQTPTVTQPTQPVVPQAAPSTLSSAQINAIKQSQQKNRAANEERAAKTTVDRLLIDKPDPATYLKEDMTVVPTIADSKLQEYEAALVQDQANIDAFNQLKAAVKEGRALPIYISKPQNKVVGFEISTPLGEQGQETIQKKNLTMQQMLGFVTTKLPGYIPTSENSIGVKLRWNKPRPNAKASADGKPQTGSPSIMVGNKKEIINRGERCVITSQIEMNGDQPVMKQGKLRTRLSFKIVTDRKDSDGQPIIRTVRLLGDAEVPKFTRINEEYDRLFGSAERDRGIISVPGVQEAKTIEDAMTSTIEWMMQHGAGRFDVGDTLNDLDKAMQGAAAGSPADDLGM